MSQRGKGGEESSLGKPGGVGRTPVREISQRQVGTGPLELVETSTSPLTPTTPTLEAATTGTESEHSSEHGRGEGISSQQQPRQVIAVSVSKGPSAFFNLARKFLVSDEVCDLSALEGAIVSAVDAAHLLERSKIASIIRYEFPSVSCRFSFLSERMMQTFLNELLPMRLSLCAEYRLLTLL